MRSFELGKARIDGLGTEIIPIRDDRLRGGIVAVPNNRGCTQKRAALGKVQTGEFDPGSERTLAACLRHASRTVRHLRVYTSGARVSNAWVICPQVGDNFGKLELIPDESTRPSGLADKGGLSLEATARG